MANRVADDGGFQGAQQPLEAGWAMHFVFMIDQTALAIAAEPIGFG